MILGKASATNFGSYKIFEFDYADLGLTLVEGRTGAGKSTVLDVSSWVLFGVTSKAGLSDEIKSWFAEAPTEGMQEVTLPDGKITVRRVRGNATQNDLYWTEANGDPIRGKDLKETQKLLEKRLGVTAELYLAGAYIHQFDESEIIFIADAKERRKVLDKIADTTLAAKLAEHASESRKMAKAELEDKRLLSSKLDGKLEEANDKLIGAKCNAADWQTNQTRTIADAKNKAQNFEAERVREVAELVTRLEELDKKTVHEDEYEQRLTGIRKQQKQLASLKEDHKARSVTLNVHRLDLKMLQSEYTKLTTLDGGTCPTCLGPCNSPKLKERTTEIAAQVKDLEGNVKKFTVELAAIEQGLAAEDRMHKDYDKVRTEQQSNSKLLGEFEAIQNKVLVLRSVKNNYAERLKEIEAEINPFNSTVDKAEADIERYTKECNSVTTQVGDLEHRVASLTWLYDKSFELRGMMLKRAVEQINTRTNEYLEKYFDADLRVKFVLPEQDKLEVELTNDGYPCSFKQLSGGERCMLKFTFKLAYMEKAEDRAGVKFSTVLFDEALTGMDDALKAKAFTLLQALETKYTSIILVDHLESFKSLFTNKFSVVKLSNISQLTCEENN